MSDAVAGDPRLGSVLAGYRIERLLGRGGMSDVYLAEDSRLKRKVALKLMASDLAGDGRFRERFLRESELAAALDHPNVIPIYEAGEAGGALFIAMRYVEGSDLARRLARDGRLDPVEAVSILERVADALNAAHRRGLVHRDVKPGNVLLSDEGHVYLSDFGLTRSTEDSGALTESGQFVGTMDYVAPEQIENTGVSPATDVYALACVSFECLTGERPFAGDSTVGLLFAHLQDEPPSASERNDELPGELDAVLARGMAKRPDERFATCGELVAGARAALGLSGELARPVVAPGRGRRRVLVAVALAIAVVVAAVVAAVLVTGGDEQGAVGDEWGQVVQGGSVFGGSAGERARGLATGETGLVAVGTSGPFNASPNEGQGQNAAVWTSPDGVSWTRVRDADLSGPDLQFMTDVAAGPDGLVAVGTVGTPTELEGVDDFDAAVWTSPDGAGWERVADGEDVFGGPPYVEGVAEARRNPRVIDLPSFQGIAGVVSAGPGFVAVGSDWSTDEAVVWTSTDGTQWSRVPANAQVFGSRAPERGRALMQRVAASEDGRRLVAVGVDALDDGTSAGAVWVSLDGASWTRVPHEDAVFGGASGRTEIQGVVAGGPGFVAVGAEAPASQAPTGPQGRLLPFVEDVFETGISTDGLRGAIWTSVDGLVWSRVASQQLPSTGEEAVRLYAVAAGGPGLVAVGWRGPREALDPVVWTSPDGETWSAAADEAGVLRSQGGQIMAGVLATETGLVAVGAEGSAQGFAAAVWTSPCQAGTVCAGGGDPAAPAASRPPPAPPPAAAEPPAAAVEAALPGTITTVVGSGGEGFSGDGGPATEAQFSFLAEVVFGPDGEMYVADGDNYRIRKIDANGVITTFAGTGTAGSAGDGGQAVEAQLIPIAPAFDAAGNLYVGQVGSPSRGATVRRIDTDGVITTVAGSGELAAGSLADSGRASEAQLSDVAKLRVSGDGVLYITDVNHHRILRVDTDGTYTTIAGTGEAGFSGDGGPATEAELNAPWAIALGPDGSIYFSDSDARIRKIDTDGIITTVAGTGVEGFSGDGGPATEARLSWAVDIAFDADGNLYFSDSLQEAGFNHLIRRIGTDGVITTVAGTGVAGFSGDGGPATEADLDFPTGLTIGPDGNLYFADTGNHRIRKVILSSTP